MNPVVTRHAPTERSRFYKATFVGRYLASRIRESAGYTLVEVVVATSLVATVLVPLSSAAIYVLTARQNERYLVALALGRRAMEETLARRNFESRTMRVDGGRWRIQKTVVAQTNQVTIIIRVFRRNHPQPLVDLMTVRLLS